MKQVFLFIVFFPCIIFCQNTAFKNFGDIQIHDDGQIGFHTDLINDGNFDNDNLGLVGFYHDTETLNVSGLNRAVFHNIEIDVLENLNLLTSLGLSNQLSFVNGKVLTNRNNLNVSLDFINHDFYVGEDDVRHVDGYVSNIGNSSNFTFPIGDDNKLREMIISRFDRNTVYNGAYFFEDPNFPTTFSTSFSTTETALAVNTVSNYEFWDLNGSEQTIATLTWDEDSSIETIATQLSSLVVVGWNIENNRWENLGNSSLSGDFNSGRISSIPFIPNEYEIITFGSSEERTNNFLISPNGEGPEGNERVIFEELEEYAFSEFIVFNRWGNLVFRRKNYQNDFRGVSEGRATINKDQELPIGTYFYELNFGDTEKFGKFIRGYIYITR